MKRFVIVVVLGLLIAAVVMAQDVEVPEECQAAKVADTLSDFASQVDKGETDLGAVIDELLALRAGCDDLAWSSDEDGMQPVIGPVTLPEGLYRFAVETDGFMIAELEVIDGDCESKSILGLFNLMQGQGNGAQQLVESSGCETLIIIGNTSDAWTMTAQKLK